MMRHLRRHLARFAFALAVGPVLCGTAALCRTAALAQGSAQEPDADVPSTPDAATTDASAAGPDAAPLPRVDAAIEAVLDLLEQGQPVEAHARAAVYDARYAALASDDPLRPSERDRALLDYSGALAAGAAADALAAGAEPDLERIAELEADGVARFERALVAAGSGFERLRRRAAYAVGTLLAHAAERRVRRAQRLAITQKQQVPFADGTPERELLEESEEGFERARDALVRRLEIEWSDEDTRANLEWVQRRLMEIERIRQRADEEQQRQEEEQEEQEQEEQQEQEQQDQQERSEPESGEPDESEGEDASEDGAEADPEGAEEESSQEESSEEGAPQQPEDEAEGAEDESAPPAGEESESEGSEESDSAEEAAEEGAAGELAEPLVLSDTEVRRLLQRLTEIEQEGEALRRRMAASQRRRVERDW